jgi:hypothetical protein
MGAVGGVFGRTSPSEGSTGGTGLTLTGSPGGGGLIITSADAVQNQGGGGQGAFFTGGDRGCVEAPIGAGACGGPSFEATFGAAVQAVTRGAVILLVFETWRSFALWIAGQSAGGMENSLDFHSGGGGGAL